VEPLECKDQWYTNKELFEQIQDLKGQIISLTAGLQETNKLIKEYNGLRLRIDNCEQRFSEIFGRGVGAKNMYGWVIAGISLLLLIISNIER
jgi:hypothetical protein